jgi:hypothetical protein
MTTIHNISPVVPMEMIALAIENNFCLKNVLEDILSKAAYGGVISILELVVSSDYYH